MASGHDLRSHLEVRKVHLDRMKTIVLSQPIGVISLMSKRADINVRPGSGLLLRVLTP